MANIDEELKIIKGSPDGSVGGRGEDVRAAIISAINKIIQEREYPPTTLLVNTNGEKTGGPWNKVIVNVSGGLDTKNIDNCGTITENDYYDLKKLKKLGLIDNPNCIGVDGFLVNVNQKTGEYGEITITENGVYDPLLDGYDGYSKVYVNVLGGEIKDYYTVRFFDGTRMLEAKSVQRGTNAIYTGTTRLSGTNFTGWNPSPVSVSRDMDCYAVYADGASSLLIDRYSETIPDSWAQIVEKIGTRPYGEGSTKNLLLTTPAGNILLNMCLIGYNLDVDDHEKYVSTWVNINWDVITKHGDALVGWPFGIFSKTQLSYANQKSTFGDTIWWGNSLLRALLNGDNSNLVCADDIAFYDSMVVAGTLVPNLIDVAAGTSLFRNLKLVTKYSTKYNIDAGGTAAIWRDQMTQDRIWLPSTRELFYPSYNNEGVPSYTVPNYMCTKGKAEKGVGGYQYGNPNVLSNTIGPLGPPNFSGRTRDALPSSVGTEQVGIADRRGVGVGYTFGQALFSQQYTNDQPLMIGFCI